MRKNLRWVSVLTVLLVLLVVTTSGCAPKEPAVEPGGETSVETAMVLIGMHADIMESIEEAFGYILLGDVEEKADFENKMADFNKCAEQFQASTTLS